MRKGGFFDVFRADMLVFDSSRQNQSNRSTDLNFRVVNFAKVVARFLKRSFLLLLVSQQARKFQLRRSYVLPTSKL